MPMSNMNRAAVRNAAVHKTVITALSALLVSACATTPPASSLMAGINAADAAKSSPSAGTLRAADDPVCEQFYENALQFSQAANQPNPAGKFFASTGVSVVAAVATNGILGGLGNSLADVALRSATSEIVLAGSNTALSGLNNTRAPDRMIIKQAGEIGCPVQVI